MKPNDKVEEKEEEEGPALAYGPLTQEEFILASLSNLRTRNDEQEDTILRLRSAFANQQEGFATLQAAAEHANQALLAGNLGHQVHQALGAALVLSREQFHRRELAQEQENKNQGNNNNE